MSPDQRETARVRFESGMKPAAIAAMLGEPEADVRAALHLPSLPPASFLGVPVPRLALVEPEEPSLLDHIVAAGTTSSERPKPVENVREATPMVEATSIPAVRNPNASRHHLSDETKAEIHRTAAVNPSWSMGQIASHMGLKVGAVAGTLRGGRPVGAMATKPRTGVNSADYWTPEKRAAQSERARVSAAERKAARELNGSTEKPSNDSAEASQSFDGEPSEPAALPMPLANTGAVDRATAALMVAAAVSEDSLLGDLPSMAKPEAVSPTPKPAQTIPVAAPIDAPDQHPSEWYTGWNEGYIVGQRAGRDESAAQPVTVELAEIPSPVDAFAIELIAGWPEGYDCGSEMRRIARAALARRTRP